MKHTNMMKGWQPRYFRLEPKQAILSYYIVSIDNKFYDVVAMNVWGGLVVLVNTQPVIWHGLNFCHP